MKEVFVTKDDLKVGLRTVKTELLIELSKTREEIVRQVGDIIHDKLFPYLNIQDRRISRVEKHIGLPPLVD